MFTNGNTFRRSLSDSLVMKSISTEEEVEQLEAFNISIHGEEVKNLTRHLINHHPRTNPDQWLMIIDEQTDQIVSSLCLIPWTWRYEEVELRAGEMGIVGTLPEYRGHGLIRQLDRRFKELLDEGGFDVSHIQGIRYFYRLFGYEYAMPLQVWNSLELRDIPDGDDAISFRPATVDDIPMLSKLYDEAGQTLGVSAVRDEESWRYLFEYGPSTECGREFYLALNTSGEVSGYWGIEPHGFGEGLNVSETSLMDYQTARASIRKFKALAIERQKPYVRLNLPDSILIETARSMGLKDDGIYPWQILIPDTVRFLKTIAPVLERRIAESPYMGISEMVIINQYRNAAKLQIEAGKITAIERQPGMIGHEISIPPNVFAPLVLGYLSVDTLIERYPDFSVDGANSGLIRTMFPEMESFIYEQY
ncbi:MAG: GNAT family N-acetyltransferase [Anaerolineae bacterium]|nr:GNAT family N-acetyltransferase [Anaerolineae bacterium]